MYIYSYIYICHYISGIWTPYPGIEDHPPGALKNSPCFPTWKLLRRGPDSLISDCMCCWIASQQRGAHGCVAAQQRHVSWKKITEDNLLLNVFWHLHIHMISISQIWVKYLWFGGSEFWLSNLDQIQKMSVFLGFAPTRVRLLPVAWSRQDRCGCRWWHFWWCSAQSADVIADQQWQQHPPWDFMGHFFPPGWPM